MLIGITGHGLEAAGQHQPRDPTILGGLCHRMGSEDVGGQERVPIGLGVGVSSQVNDRLHPVEES